MNNEQYTVAEFIRGVTWAESMTARVTIAGRPYMAGELLADASDASGHEYLDEVFGVLTRVARNGDEAARDLIRRMGETFAYNNCEPGPEADDIDQRLAYQDRGEYDAQTDRVPQWLNLAA